MSDIDNEFNKLLKKAEDEELKSKMRTQKIYKNIMLALELTFQLSGFAIIVYTLGWLVAAGLFLLLTGTNMQVIRNISDKFFDNRK